MWFYHNFVHLTCDSGTKRFDSEKAGDREVQRTMLELLNQMDGFQPNAQIKVHVVLNHDINIGNFLWIFLWHCCKTKCVLYPLWISKLFLKL